MILGAYAHGMNREKQGAAGEIESQNRGYEPQRVTRP